MDGLVSGHTRTYDDFKKQLSSQVKPVFEEIRNYCFSLGNNVIEDVRMHRIVFCKSMTFRHFADIEPQRESVIAKIRRDRKEPIREIEVKPEQSLDDLKNLLAEAYSNIR
jgi:predicted transport protein